VPFTVVSSQAEELTTGGDARVLAEKNAAAKVRSASPLGAIPPGAFVLGTDTLVTIDGVVMGKPASAAKAREMLAALAGRTHEVVSGVALLRTPEAVCPPGTGASAGAEAGLGAEAALEALCVASTVTEVTFEPLAAAQIDAYVASGEGKGKAGAYAVQGLAALFVSGVRGEYSNVVGLPLCLLNGMFRELGFDLLRREWLW
jgi:septum formation protein